MIDSQTQRNSVQTCTLVYAVMVILTLLTWAVGMSGAGGLSLSLTVLFVALLKGQLVGDWFMGLRAVHGWWRWVVFGWLLIPGSLITLAFVLADRG